MPPLSSTGIKSAARRLYYTISPKARTIANARAKIGHALRSAPHHAKALIVETFPSISIPAHQLGQPINIVRSFHASARARARPSAVSGLGTRLRPAARQIRGAALPAHVGLHPSPVRMFSSTGTLREAANANVPVAMRALAYGLGLVDEGDVGSYKTMRMMRKAGSAKALERRERYNALPRSVSISSKSTPADLELYFPTPPQTELHTPGTTTYLVLPLAPSLLHLLQLSHPPSISTSLSYEQTSIATSYLSSHLTSDLLPLHTLFTSHAQERVIPLLHRLDALDALRNTTLDVVISRGRGDYGEPEALRLMFEERSLGDVRALLGASYLLAAREGRQDEEWFTMYEVPTGRPISPLESISTISTPCDSLASSITPSTSSHSSNASEVSDELPANEWTSVDSLNTSTALIMPTLDFSEYSAWSDFSATSSAAAEVGVGGIGPFEPAYSLPGSWEADWRLD